MVDNLCKLAIEHGGSIERLLIPSNESKGLGLTNPTVLITDNKYLVNIRHVQYSLYHSENSQRFPNQWGPLAYINPENDLTLTTTNYFLKENKVTRINTSKLDVEPLWEFVGLEDGRLVEWEGNIYLCGVRRDTTTNGVGRLEMSKIVKGKEVERYRIEPPKDTYCEKNWMPILDKPFHFVKWSNPTEIVKVDLASLTATTDKLVEQKVTFPRDIRGGSQVIPYGDNYIAITHEVDLFKDGIGRKDAHYYHRFVMWNKDWEIINYSPEFKFMTGNIEFCCGLAFEEGVFTATFGFQDSTAYLLKIPEKVVLSLMGNPLDTEDINYEVKSTLEGFIRTPQDEEYSYDLAKLYYHEGHYASAISFFLRTAEYGVDKNKIYLSMIYIGLCLRKQGNRIHSEIHSYLNAITADPHRKEAYLFLSECYENKQDHNNAYLTAVVGYNAVSTFIETVEEFSENKLKFQMAVNVYRIGNYKLAKELFLSLEGKMQSPYKELIENNITYLKG